MKYTKLLTIFLIVIISIAGILGLFIIHPSSWGWYPGTHITQMEFDGTDWALTYVNPALPLNNIFGKIDKYVEYYQSKPSVNHNPTNIKFITEIPLSHFGYEKNTTILKTVSGQHQYLMLRESVKQAQFVVPDGIVSRTPRFSTSDYVRLNTDPTANKIYTNPGMDVFKL